MKVLLSKEYFEFLKFIKKTCRRNSINLTKERNVTQLFIKNYHALFNLILHHGYNDYMTAHLAYNKTIERLPKWFRKLIK